MRRISTRLAAVVIPALLVVGALTSRQTTAQAPQAVGVIALTNARVIDGTGRPAVERATIVMRNGRIEAFGANAAVPAGAVRVDGGMVANDWVCQFLADILDVPVERPAVIETTALGAAYLAGLEVGLYPSLEALAGTWRCERRFEPRMSADQRQRLYAGWQDAVRRTRSAV